MDFPKQVQKGGLTVLRKMASPKKVFAVVSAGMTLLAVARVVVDLSQAYSSVRSERLGDAGLMQLCDNPTSEATTAPDFRALCLRKRAERAAPILLKALLRAVTNAFSEFCEVFSSPSRVALLVLFSLTGIAAPVVRALAALFVQNIKRRRLKRGPKYTTSDSEESGDDDREGHYQVVEISPRHQYNTRERMGLTLRRGLNCITAPQMLTTI